MQLPYLKWDSEIRITEFNIKFKIVFIQDESSYYAFTLQDNKSREIERQKLFSVQDLKKRIEIIKKNHKDESDLPNEEDILDENLRISFQRYINEFFQREISLWKKRDTREPFDVRVNGTHTQNGVTLLFFKERFLGFEFNGVLMSHSLTEDLEFHDVQKRYYEVLDLDPDYSLVPLNSVSKEKGTLSKLTDGDWSVWEKNKNITSKYDSNSFRLSEKKLCYDNRKDMVGFVRFLLDEHLKRFKGYRLVKVGKIKKPKPIIVSLSQMEDLAKKLNS